MKKILALLLCLSLTACTNSNSYFNEVNPYFEENFDEQNMNYDELKEYQSDYYNSDDAGELEKNFYNAAVLNDYNMSSKDPLFMKYYQYQIYGIGEAFSVPNKLLLSGSPTNEYGSVFEISVIDIDIYNSVLDVGYSKMEIQNKNISKLNEDGTPKTGFELVGVEIEMSGNGNILTSFFDVISSHDKEKESQKNVVPLFCVEANEKGHVVLKANEQKTIYLWLLIDTQKFDYDDLYLTFGADRLNMMKSFVGFSNVLGDGLSQVGASDEYIRKIEEYFTAPSTDEKAKKYYELVKNDILTGKESPITIDSCKYQVYSGEDIKMKYPFEYLVETDPDYYANNSMDISVRGLYIFDSLSEKCNTFADFDDKVSPFSDIYDQVVDDADSTASYATHFKNQLKMYNRDGYFLDENGEVSDTHKLIFCLLDIDNYMLNTFWVEDIDSIELYYIPTDKSESVLLQEYMYSPYSPSTSWGFDFEHYVSVIGNEWIIDTEKYPLEDLYIGIGFFENENYKKSFIKVSSSTKDIHN